MKELIVATTNQGKVKEIQAMLKDLNIEVKSLKDVYDDVPDIVEDGKTFKENALLILISFGAELEKITFTITVTPGFEFIKFPKAPSLLSISL